MTTATMTDLELSHAHAARYLAEQFDDGRDFGQLLADMRCGKRKACIPFHRGPRRTVHYYRSDLDVFVASEVHRTRAAKPVKRVLRVVGALGSTLPPSRVLAIV